MNFEIQISKPLFLTEDFSNRANTLNIISKTNYNLLNLRLVATYYKREASEIEKGKREKSERRQRVESGELYMYICKIKYVYLSNNCKYAVGIHMYLYICKKL